MAQKLESAIDESLQTGERARRKFKCTSTGLNGSSIASPLNAMLCITSEAVVVAHEKTSIPFKKVVTERFDRAQILGVREGDEPLPGAVGVLARKNATHALGRAMGQTGGSPAVTLQTRRGDIVLFFKPKERGAVREAHVAISDLLNTTR